MPDPENQPKVETPPDIFADGWEIVKDKETDYYRLSARFWVEETGLLDTVEEAIAYYRGCMGVQ